jgi:hypothetical protein
MSHEDTPCDYLDFGDASASISGATCVIGTTESMMLVPLLLFVAVVSIAVLIAASLGKRESGSLKSRHGILVIFLGLALAFTGTTISTLFPH